MTQGRRAAILGAVRRTRRRLEGIHLLKTTARGVVCGAVAGTVLLLSLKLFPDAAGIGSTLAWSLVAAGAVAGLGRGIVTRRVDLSAAALFLDDRLATRQGIVTLLTCPEGRFAPRVEHAVGTVKKLPRMPFPREAGWLPAALFLLFAAGQVPARTAKRPEERSRWIAVPAAAGEIEQERGETSIPAGAMERLAAGETPGASAAAMLRTAIDRRIARPEDRRAAREALQGALRGDGSAARALARALDGQQGFGAAPGPGPGSKPGPGATVSGNRTGAAVIRAEAYPEARDFLRRYRAALAKEEGK